MIHMFDIMSLAHKLNLMRCYRFNEYNSAVQRGHDYLVEKSEEQQNGLNHLFQSVSARMAATGDPQFCTFDENRKMVVPVNHSYDPIFIRASIDPRECLNFCLHADLEKPEAEMSDDLESKQEIVQPIEQMQPRPKLLRYQIK